METPANMDSSHDPQGKERQPLMRSDSLSTLLQEAGAQFEAVGSSTGKILHYGDAAAEALACFGHGCLRDRSGAARLAVTGNDRKDFINRMCTNDVRKVAADRSVRAALTTAKGRIVDHLQVLDGPDDRLVLLGSDQMGDALKTYLEKFIVMEDCTVEDRAADLGLLEIWGEAGHAAVARVAGAAPAPVAENFQAVSGRVGDETFPLVGTQSPGGPGILALLPAAKVAAFAQALLAEGLQPVGEVAYEQARIEAGIPALHHELGDHCNPLEAGLQNSVSFTKGCYIGQEVVARLNSYSKVRRHLRGLRFPIDAEPAQIGEVFQNLLRIGNVTSAVRSPRLGYTAALGLIKAGYESAGGEVEVVTDGKHIHGTLCDLPFTPGD